MISTEGVTSILATEITNVIAGIDTHADTHHVAVINEYGKPISWPWDPATGRS